MKHLSNDYVLAGTRIMRESVKACQDGASKAVRRKHYDEWVEWFAQNAIAVTQAVQAILALEYLAENVYLEEVFSSELFRREVERRTLPEALIGTANAWHRQKAEEASAAARQGGDGSGQD